MVAASVFERDCCDSVGDDGSLSSMSMSERSQSSDGESLELRESFDMLRSLLSAIIVVSGAGEGGIEGRESGQDR